MMKRYNDLVNDCLPHIEEVFPWDLADDIAENPDLLLIDVSEPDEFSRVHIPGSLNVARGILESACEYDYDETVPVLAAGRDRDLVLVCRLRPTQRTGNLYADANGFQQGTLTQNRPARLE